MLGPRYLVRHGDYLSSPQEILTLQGLKESRAARERLLSMGLGSNALLLTSSAPRAVQTSRIISSNAGLASETGGAHQSDALNVGGNSPHRVESLEDYIQHGLEECGLREEQGEGLVIVTHAPLIKRVMHMQYTSDVAYGGVYDITAAEWQNTDLEGNL